MRDRVGIGWRPTLAAGIFESREEIDIVEVIADDCFDPAHARAVKTLARQVPVTLHCVSCGMASCARVEQKRLEHLARLVGTVEPESWSEHLAFVRAGGHEIGHLAAPPRNENSVDGAIANIERARRVMGSAPQMENISTLVDPPASTMDEPEWIDRIVRGADCGLLLDLHNLHANASNFNFDAKTALRRLPLDRVSHIHIAGGKLLPSRNGEPSRILDDHLHPVPPSVYELLSEVAELVRQPLTVILERDGAFPAMDVLLEELRLARASMAEGRARQSENTNWMASALIESANIGGVNSSLEALMANLFCDHDAMRRFLSDPATEARRHGLSETECLELQTVDRTGLQLAATSFARKRASKAAHRRS